jgi:hypothetical protein
MITMASAIRAYKLPKDRPLMRSWRNMKIPLFL